MGGITTVQLSMHIFSCFCINHYDIMEWYQSMGVDMEVKNKLQREDVIYTQL